MPPVSRGVEERVLVDFLRPRRVMADEDQVDLLVVARQEQVEQVKKRLARSLLVLVHRRRDVHQAEHHRLRGRLRHG